MSILVVHLAPEGLLFGADRNITSQATFSSGATMLTVTGQSERPKVLKWPNVEVIVGYVGQAELEGQPTDQWLYAYIGRNLTFDSLADVAETLRAELDALFQAGDFEDPTYRASPHQQASPCPDVSRGLEETCGVPDPRLLCLLRRVLPPVRAVRGWRRRCSLGALAVSTVRRKYITALAPVRLWDEYVVEGT